MLSKNSVIYGFLCISWVLITMVPRNTVLGWFLFKVGNPVVCLTCSFVNVCVAGYIHARTGNLESQN